MRFFRNRQLPGELAKGRMPLNHIVRGILEAVRPGPPAKPRIGSGAIGVDAATGRPRESSGLGVAILDKLTHQLATDPKVASDRDWLAAVSLAVRDIGHSDHPIAQRVGIPSPDRIREKANPHDTPVVTHLNGHAPLRRYR